jgi:hypothetical protein
MHPAAEFIVNWFGPRAKGRIYIASLPNPELRGTPEGEPAERHILSRSSEQIADFTTKWDQPGRAVYWGPATLKPNATRRSKDNIAELLGLQIDIDFKSVDATPEEIERVVKELPLPPTRLRNTGHGLQGFWGFETAIPGAPESIAEHERLQRLLADHLGGDRAACDACHLMRMPGTVNSKGGDSTPVRELVTDGPFYTLHALRTWLDSGSALLIRRKADDKAGNGGSPDNPFLAFAAAYAGEEPLDVERLLAEMVYLGPGGGGNAHDTLLRCTATLIRRGESRQATIERCLAALCLAAARSGAAFHEARERGAIEEMCASAAEKFPPKPERPEPESPEPEPEPFRPLATAYVCPDPASIPPREFLLGRHYVRGFVTTTIAPGGTGKSSRSLVEAIAMAACKSLLGEMPRDRLRVWYFGEDPKDELDRRIAAILQHYGIRPEEIGGRLFVNSIHDLRLKELAIFKPATSGPKVIFNDGLLRGLIETFRTCELDVAIFDPLVTLHSVPENDPAAMDAVVRKFGAIAEMTRSAIDLVHHTRKPASGQTEMTVDDARGARAVIDASRAARILNRMSPKQAEDAGIEPEDRWRYFRSDTGKANLAPPDIAVWSALTSVVLPNSDNVGVVEPWAYPNAFMGVSPEDARWIRELTRDEPNYIYHSNAKDWIGLALAERLGLDPEDKADRVKLKKILKVWLNKGVIALDERVDPNTRHKRGFVVPGARDENLEPGDGGD